MADAERVQDYLPGAARARERAWPRSHALRPRRDFTLRRLLALADVLAIGTALVLATIVFGEAGTALGRLVWGLVTLPAWILLFKTYGLYDRDGKRVSHSTVDDLPSIFHALVIGALGLWLFYELLPGNAFALGEALVFFPAALVGVFLTRAGARSLAGWLIPPERVLFVGGGPMAQILIQKIRLHPEYRLQPVGYVDAADASSEGLSEELPYLGSLSELETVCRSAAVDRVVVLAPAVDDDALVDIVRRTKDLDLRISLLPHVVDVLGPSVEIDDVEGITILGVNPPILSRSSRLLKRTMDVVIASLALLVLLPLMAAIAVAVKATSPGPVFYSQERIGRGGRRFRMHKFRTMVKDAEHKRKELWDRSAHHVWLLLDHDPASRGSGRSFGARASTSYRSSGTSSRAT